MTSDKKTNRLIIQCNAIVLPEKTVSGYVCAENGTITSVTATPPEKREGDTFYDYSSRILTAGLIEPHAHGGAGHPFLGSVEDVIKACNYHFTRGVTAIMPTISAAPFPVMRKAIEAVWQAKNSGECLGEILGAHMEGPYLSEKQSGAQNTDFLSDPVPQDYEALLRDLPHAVARWTYAPERDKNGEFCRFLADCGVTATAGHSDAVYEDMLRAERAGCKAVTHLYSCTSTVTRKGGFRDLGVIESAFLSDDLFAEIIADGKHLPPNLIKMILKIKGKSRVLAVTDCLAIAGTNVKEGEMSGIPFLVEDGVCKLKDRSAFAGSVATAPDLLRVLTGRCDLSVEDAVYLLTVSPAELFRLKTKGRIAVGFDADFAVFDQTFEPVAVFYGGERKYTAT